MKKAWFGIVAQGTVITNVRSIKSRRKNSYKRYASRRLFQIVKYANETGCSAAVRKFKSLFPDLHESMAHGFSEKILDQLKLAEKRNRLLKKLIVNLQHETRQWHWWEREKHLMVLYYSRKRFNRKRL